MDSNENSHISLIPQFNRTASPGKLAELSASSNNARSFGMPPPTGVKRKTLMEQAGESARLRPAPPNYRPINAAVKATSIAGALRQNSFSSSTSSAHSRAASTSSMRTVSNSSFASSMSAASRQPSSQHRPHTALASNLPQKRTQGRPASSIDAYSNVHNQMNSARTSNSMTPFHSHIRSPAKLHSQEHLSRGSHDNQIPNWSSFASGPASRIHVGKSLRDFSLSYEMKKLSLDPSKSDTIPSLQKDTQVIQMPCTPRSSCKISLIPTSSSPTKSGKKSSRAAQFLTKDSNVKSVAWDAEARLESIEHLYAELKGTLDNTNFESSGLKESIGLYKAKIIELESVRTQLTSTNDVLQKELDHVRQSLSSLLLALEDAKRNHGIELDDLQRKHRRDVDQFNRDAEEAAHRLRRDTEKTNRDAEEETHRLARIHRDEIMKLRKRLEDAVEEEKNRRRKEVQELSTEGAIIQQRIEVELGQKEKDLQMTYSDLEQSRADLLQEQELNRDLRTKLSEAASNTINLEAAMRSLRARVEFLESDCKSQSQAFADLEQKTQDAIKEAEEARNKLRVEETLRRKLHNQVQELKGNIRVFCRIRPSLDSDPVGGSARISIPDEQGDSKEVEVMGSEEKSSLGNITTRKNAFTFDRVFTPKSQNAEIFEEISQLVQSALDGYNVCIFCYGQTGAGKTFTMSSDDGMIPRAVHQIYDTARSLEEKGWKYSMEGSFVEVYNENINDLLGKAEEFDKKKHEVRHDMQKLKTTITGIATVDLDSPSKVESILQRATENRSVAATKANERSSRSHSVFVLKLTGENSITGEKSEGTLNLVDLAGSERLSHSGSTGERLRETQNINKSLSCLGDVIGALGQGKEGGHVPYRNSKLTYLLQFSLGGNSKTLMFVMISPLQAHLNETLTSLKFATKVHNTHIGTARRQSKT